MPPSSKAVKLANKAPSNHLAAVVSKAYKLFSRAFRVQVLHSDGLKPIQRDQIWSLFETNMRGLCEASSFGWDPQAKRKELFHPLARFILVTESDQTDLAAFTSFRFEFEEGEDVIYCYELHVAPSMQGTGLGKSLMKELEKLCESYDMEKIVLTVFKANVQAAGFYKAFGFCLDPMSPNFVEDGEELEPSDIEGIDYEILSKSIPLNLSGQWKESS
ncbi:acyl-CoA N-acyltransferase [Pholiota molesta]|nr:acyl-CoA N-acyltransferase [Pholiota molesta]